MLNVLHLSDLHYTSQQRGRVRDEAKAGAQAILRLASDLKAQGILTPQVRICITGDLVQSGGENSTDLRNDFEVVQEEFLKPLLETLEIDPSKLFIVPGNHEMDRDIITERDRLVLAHAQSKPMCEADLHDDLRKKLSLYLEFIARNGYNSVSSDNPRLAVFDQGPTSIVCLNGLVGSYSRNGPDDKGHLFFLQSEFGGVLNSIPKSAIVLLHHPLSWFEDQCGVDLRDFLALRRCRLLTGHIHQQGLDWHENAKGTLATVQAGASASAEVINQVAVIWAPPSNSVAVRHYCFDKAAGNYCLTTADATQVAPKGALVFFQRTEAFYEPSVLNEARKRATEEYSRELLAASGQEPSNYISPDIVILTEDQFTKRRIHLEEFSNYGGNRVISGDELSGKTSFVHYMAMFQNSCKLSTTISIVLDFRSLGYNYTIESMIIKKLNSFGLTLYQAEYVISIGLVDAWFDNFDADHPAAIAKFNDYFKAMPRIRWSIAVKFGQRFTPSQAPSSFADEGIQYYEFSEITAPTVGRMIAQHANGKSIERPRAVIERVFRSINNLRAPRTVFYVNNLVDMFLTDAAVEPLNRYLLIENILSERLRSAHRDNLPNQAVDIDMLETFIGQIGYYLLDNELSYLSKGDYYALADEFIERKGIQRKRFNPDIILKILTDSFVLREYDDGFGFMMMSVEDYFLAKHMGKDENFREQVMSAEGLQSLPSVAEYYIAQNPNDRQRIDQILDVLKKFEDAVWPLISLVQDLAEDAIAKAAPGSVSSLQDEVLSLVGEAEGNGKNSADTVVVSGAPRQIGKSRRLKYGTEERGAVLLQLGASILGLTRTLDQVDRIEIFKKLKKILWISFYMTPMLAKHLADGGELKYRGITVRADYVGQLTKKDDRFYIILRGMLYNSMRHFSTWSGSPSFFNAAKKLREEERDEFIKAVLFAQNIEADLSDSIDSIPQVHRELNSMKLKDVIVRMYVDAMTLVPLDRVDEGRAVEFLVDATAELKPPKNAGDTAMTNVYKNNLRQNLIDEIGLNSYVGKLVKPK